MTIQIVTLPTQIQKIRISDNDGKVLQAPKAENPLIDMECQKNVQFDKAKITVHKVVQIKVGEQHAS